MFLVMTCTSRIHYYTQHVWPEHVAYQTQKLDTCILQKCTLYFAPLNFWLNIENDIYNNYIKYSFCALYYVM